MKNKYVTLIPLWQQYGDKPFVQRAIGQVSDGCVFFAFAVRTADDQFLVLRPYAFFLRITCALVNFYITRMATTMFIH